MLLRSDRGPEATAPLRSRLGWFVAKSMTPPRFGGIGFVCSGLRGRGRRLKHVARKERRPGGRRCPPGGARHFRDGSRCGPPGGSGRRLRPACGPNEPIVSALLNPGCGRARGPVPTTRDAVCRVVGSECCWSGSRHRTTHIAAVRSVGGTGPTGCHASRRSAANFCTLRMAAVICSMSPRPLSMVLWVNHTASWHRRSFSGVWLRSNHWSISFEL